MSMTQVLDQHPEAVATLALLNQAAENLAREGADRPCFDGVTIDILLTARKLHLVLASLTGPDECPQEHLAAASE